MQTYAEYMCNIKTSMRNADGQRKRRRWELKNRCGTLGVHMNTNDEWSTRTYAEKSTMRNARRNHKTMFLLTDPQKQHIYAEPKRETKNYRI